jgi:hypothetical protein
MDPKRRKAAPNTRLLSLNGRDTDTRFTPDANANIIRARLNAITRVRREDRGTLHVLRWDPNRLADEPATLEMQSPAPEHSEMRSPEAMNHSARHPDVLSLPADQESCRLPTILYVTQRVIPPNRQPITRKRHGSIGSLAYVITILLSKSRCVRSVLWRPMSFIIQTVINANWADETTCVPSMS